MSSDELKKFRKRKGWSQQRLADELEVSIHAVQAWEQGKNPVPGIIEKFLLAQAEVNLPLAAVLEISEFAKSRNIAFDAALLMVIKKGLSKE